MQGVLLVLPATGTADVHMGNISSSSVINSSSSAPSRLPALELALSPALALLRSRMGLAPPADEARLVHNLAWQLSGRLDGVLLHLRAVAGSLTLAPRSRWLVVATRRAPAAETLAAEAEALVADAGANPATVPATVSLLLDTAASLYMRALSEVLATRAAQVTSSIGVPHAMSLCALEAVGANTVLQQPSSSGASGAGADAPASPAQPQSAPQPLPQPLPLASSPSSLLQSEYVLLHLTTAAMY